MRLMSFSMTTPQVLAQTKTVTRRLGWLHARPGMLVRAVKKAMGLKRGEKIERLAILRIMSVRRERLSAITAEDVAAEGYPGKSPAWFVDKFCSAMKCKPGATVTRIEFEYLPEEVKP